LVPLLFNYSYYFGYIYRLNYKRVFRIQECCLASAWYEVLSVVHMMAMLALFEANLTLIPKNGQVGGERKVSEGLLIFLQ